jgi:DNA mismatch repair ATPase MutS
MSDRSPLVLVYDESACQALSIFSKSSNMVTSTALDDEFTQSKEGRRKDSLFMLLAFTKTHMGLKLLKSWLKKPLTCNVKIHARQMWITAFLRNAVVRYSLRDSSDNLAHFPDLEKIGEFIHLTIRATEITVNRLNI